MTYTKPEIVELGSVTELTLGVGSDGVEWIPVFCGWLMHHVEACPQKEF